MTKIIENDPSADQTPPDKPSPESFFDGPPFATGIPVGCPSTAKFGLILKKNSKNDKFLFRA